MRVETFDAGLENTRDDVVLERVDGILVLCLAVIVKGKMAAALPSRMSSMSFCYC